MGNSGSVTARGGLDQNRYGSQGMDSEETIQPAKFIKATVKACLFRIFSPAIYQKP
jgi:hypothetical protein